MLTNFGVQAITRLYYPKHYYSWPKMFCNRTFVLRKVVGQLLRASFQLNNSCKYNFFSTIRRFRNNETFSRVKKQGAVAINNREKLTSTYSSVVCKSEDANDDVNQQKNRESVFKEISNGDPEIEKKLKVIEFELAVFADSRSNPFIDTKKKDWELLLQTPGYSTRQKYYMYLWKRTRSTENDKLKKEKRRKEYLMKKEEEEGKEENKNQYKLNQNSMFIRIYDKALVRMANLRLIDALSFSQHIVFDCSYESYMSHLNAKFCANQIALAYAQNRMHPAPFHVKLCNVNRHDHTMKNLNKFLNGVFDETFLWDIHEKSYLDFYDKERLVYLSPNARQELFEYNHEDVYIIGAYVDRGAGKKISLAKAKENNLRMAKLPLDCFLDWKQGMKSLSLNHVMSIMLDMRLYNDWNVALKNVPHRFYYSQQ